MNANIVGILNLTPDSFSDGGRYRTPEDAIAEAALMFEQGASWVDVGGESTRPEASPVEVEEEWRRLEPVLGPLIRAYPGCISLDTRHPEIVRLALQNAGPVILNDVTNFSNPAMIEVAAEFGLLCVASHIPDIAKGDVHSAHLSVPKLDSIEQVADEQLARAELMTQQGIARELIKLDPGFGFVKTPRLNLELVEYAKYIPGFEVCLGASRKTTLCLDPVTLLPIKELEKMNKEDRTLWLDHVSAELGVVAARKGVSHLRVHNVAVQKKLLDSARDF